MRKINIAIIDNNTEIINATYEKLISNTTFIIEKIPSLLIEKILEKRKKDFDLIIADPCTYCIANAGLCALLQDKFPNTPLFIVSNSNHNDCIITAMRAGISGVIFREDYLEDLSNAIDSILKGKTYLSYSTKANFTSIPRKKTKYNLTKREIEIVQFLIKGFTSKQIAEKLFISSRTVDKHRSNMMEKYKVNSVIELINFVQKNNLA
jgi:DNA-binding NarL/FixJ family response regulator